MSRDSQILGGAGAVPVTQVHGLADDLFFQLDERKSPGGGIKGESALGPDGKFELDMIHSNQWKLTHENGNTVFHWCRFTQNGHTDLCLGSFGRSCRKTAPFGS